MGPYENNNFVATDDNREEGGAPEGTTDNNGQFWNAIFGNADDIIGSIIGGDSPDNPVPGYNRPGGSQSSSQKWIWLVVAIIGIVVIALSLKNKKEA